MNAEKLLAMAQNLENSGEVLNAVETYKQIIKEYPDSKEANLARFALPDLKKNIPTSSEDVIVKDMPQSSSHPDRKPPRSTDKPYTYKSDYHIARVYAIMTSFLGWIILFMGAVLLILAITQKKGDIAYSVSIILIMAGFWNVALGQLMRAGADNADHTREILNLLRRKL